VRNLRSLTDTEIGILEFRGCFCKDWSNVTVSTEFDPLYCRNVEFSGVISIGRLGKKAFTMYGMEKISSIVDVVLSNVTIGNDCYIRNVTSGIANYTINDNVFIENVRLLAVEGETTFANGVMVPVMNEQGGRSIPMFSELSAQIAYLLAFYRHRPVLITALQKIISTYVDTVRSSTGAIGNCTKIINCESITNTNIGTHAMLNGVRRIHNSSINSSELAPIELGVGVIIDSVIINGNSRIIDGAIVDTCFIGEGCELSKHFSAEKSLFFSNFIGHHGEAFGIFAGPHTATHHKSTLLISAYMSFLNAGSGSNQSNHMYKLGPLHQGVIDRGSKTSSDSYILWPAHIGAFTLIMGRHMNHPDIRDLPYSYLIENNGESLLLPGVNFKSVGTIRDADKWPTRDNRVTCVDVITYDLLTPYTIGKMIQGKAVLKELISTANHNERHLRYNGTIIPLSAAEKGIEYYNIGIIKFIGNLLIKKLIQMPFTTHNELIQLLTTKDHTGTTYWSDMAGMIICQESLSNLIEEIENNQLMSSQDITLKISSINNNYDKFSWNWCTVQMADYLGHSLETVSIAEINHFIENWMKITQKLDQYFLEDAEKEFSMRTKISFGIDGDTSIRELDFNAVRGYSATNSFINKIHVHLSDKTIMYNTAKEKLSKLLKE